jgi:hypothetical protein
MAFSKPKKPKPVPVPKTDTGETQAAADEALRMQRARAGRSSTMVASGSLGQIG